MSSLLSIKEKFLEAGDSFEGQRVTSQCDLKSGEASFNMAKKDYMAAFAGFVIYKSQYSVCDRTVSILEAVGR